jgi:hypothetical protein
MRACVSLSTDTFASWALPIQATLVPVNPEPVTVMMVPTGPDDGENPEMLCCGYPVEAWVNVKDVAENAECDGFSNATGPLVASDGTVTFAWVSLMTLIAASWALPTQAWFEPVKPDPFTVITVPTAPEDGEKDLIDWRAYTVPALAACDRNSAMAAATSLDVRVTEPAVECGWRRSVGR